MHRTIGVSVRIVNRIHPMREVAACGEIGEDHVCRQRDQ
jgi:hypothetical protein